MTYTEFVAELERASLTIRAFASLLGMRPNSVSNYASAGKVPKHLALIATLLGELKARGVASDAAIARAGPLAKAEKPVRRRRFGGNPQKDLDLGA